MSDAVATKKEEQDLVRKQEKENQELIPKRRKENLATKTPCWKSSTKALWSTQTSKEALDFQVLSRRWQMFIHHKCCLKDRSQGR